MLATLKKFVVKPYDKPAMDLWAKLGKKAKLGNFTVANEEVVIQSGDETTLHAFVDGCLKNELMIDSISSGEPGVQLLWKFGFRGQMIIDLLNRMEDNPPPAECRMPKFEWWTEYFTIVMEDHDVGQKEIKMILKELKIRVEIYLGLSSMRVTSPVPVSAVVSSLIEMHRGDPEGKWFNAIKAIDPSAEEAVKMIYTSLETGAITSANVSAREFFSNVTTWSKMRDVNKRVGELMKKSGKESSSQDELEEKTKNEGIKLEDMLHGLYLSKAEGAPPKFDFDPAPSKDLGAADTPDEAPASMENTTQEGGAEILNEALKPEALDQETRAPEMPAPETLATEMPAPEMPAPEMPAPEMPAPEMPAKATPATETPATETPATETPVAKTPGSDDTEMKDVEAEALGGEEPKAPSGDLMDGPVRDFRSEIFAEEPVGGGREEYGKSPPPERVSVKSEPYGQTSDKSSRKKTPQKSMKSPNSKGQTTPGGTKSADQPGQTLALQKNDPPKIFNTEPRQIRFNTLASPCTLAANTMNAYANSYATAYESTQQRLAQQPGRGNASNYQLCFFHAMPYPAVTIALPQGW
jgi:hypothetical protein